ncbi:MAG TPA: hypothetical protein VFV38_00350 [Ktedonobacteraceae bacterium]|nr:hypothetical protein [Ktedonobacteraceae bacterium]
MSAEEAMDNLPLLELFTRLRQAGLPLGIDEYQLCICALQHGFGRSDRAALARLCKTLWIKSGEEERLFEYQFAQIFPLDPVSEVDSSALPASSEPPETSALPPISTETSASSLPTSAPELTLALGEDEAQVARALRQTGSEENFERSLALETDEYFPITRRQMKQSWRYLRRPLRQGPHVELDIAATITQVGRLGMLLEPVLAARRTNQAELVLFIDQGGSMVPFHALARRLADTARRGGRLGQAHLYYFHNWPEEYLSHDPYHLETEPLADVLQHLAPERAVALVFSDAGAARGNFHETHIDQIAHFLEQVRRQVRALAWLNPMPRDRWSGTTAGEIATLVPMFDLSRRGLDQAINVLRGRPAPFFQRERRRSW